MFLRELAKIKSGVYVGRASSYDPSGRNADWWIFKPGESRVIADVRGPGMITHIWMTTGNHYRDVLIKITWDDNEFPSVLCPMGDFFGLGHSIMNSYQSFLFSSSTSRNNKKETGSALNCYVPMPFQNRAKIELINESKQEHRQYFHVDYETYDSPKEIDGYGYFHAEFRRENPFGGWGHEIRVNCPESDIVNKERDAWENNYVIADIAGKGTFIGCTLSVSNFQKKNWWGEGDEMIWIDGYKWPPDLHGTGSEDYLNQAWGMQPNAFLRNGSSIYEMHAKGYQSSYIQNVDNPIRFNTSLKVTIEIGHGNHLRNEVSSVGYWYAEKPAKVLEVPPLEKRMPVQLKGDHKWNFDPKNQITSRDVPLNDEMKKMKSKVSGKNKIQ